MNRMKTIRILALISVPFASLLSAGEANKAPGTGANTPAQSSSPAASATPSGSASTATQATSDKITLSRPTSSIEIMAEPSKVWKKLTSHEGMNAFGIMGDKKRNLDKVGDNVHGTIAGDAGNVVVTHVVKENEWRAAFEPDKGNYICSVRFMLKPQGKNTMLTYADWYSDEKPTMVDQNLKETEKSMMESLARFKGLMEKTSAEKQ